MFLHNEEKLGNSGPIWQGVAIGWHNSMLSKVVMVDSNHERIAAIKLQQSNGFLLLVSFYAPTAGHDEDFIESLSALSDLITRNSNGGDNVIIGTDANCSKNSTKRRIDAWEKFCNKFTFIVHKSDQPTFHHNNGTSESCIDFIVTSEKIKARDLLITCTLDTPQNLSAHDPVTINVDIASDPEIIGGKFTSTYTEFNRKKVVWDDSKISEYQNLVEKALDEASVQWKNPEFIPFLCSLYPRLIVQCAEMVFETKSAVTKTKAQKPHSLLVRAQNLVNSRFRKWKRAGKPTGKNNPLKTAYTTARSELQRLVRYQDNLAHVKRNNLLMHSYSHDRNKIYSLMKKIRKENTNSMTTVLTTPTGTYHGEDILEGFAADAEYLSRQTSDLNDGWSDHYFYKLCKLDNYYIFDFLQTEPMALPEMKITDLDRILTKKMKTGKSCDYYQLTVEHLRNCSFIGKQHILNLLNSIINNIYYLGCHQVKIGVGTAVYKGKKKLVTKSNLYRRITVSPIIGAILDYFVDPIAEATFRDKQSNDQLGFTAGLSYLLAAVERGECQRWALDHKMTCYGVSLDGESAFPSVERDIQIRELYHIGERGDLLKYSKQTYENTECHIKLNDKLSRKIKEKKGNRQGHVRASGHFKTYINPLLKSLNSSNLGFSIGPHCVTSVCIADDTYVLSQSPRSLQSALRIVSHYGKRYKLKFNALKTKAVVTGSKHDMEFYKNTTPWHLNGEVIQVAEENDHLGLIVSGLNEEQKNVDENLQKCRASLFSLMGPSYSFQCMLSPIVKVHLWNTYNLPILLSGLSALPIRPAQVKSLTLFQNKVFRGFLKLSQSSPTPSIYFLLGELPVEGKLHISALTLFHNIWTSPSTTLYGIAKYILMMCPESSLTWCNHIKLLCKKYSLPSPLQLMQHPACKQGDWKCLVKTRVTAWYERELRLKASCNSKMAYLNVQLSGLSGKPHPALCGINTTQDCKELRIHLKFLSGDFLTWHRRHKDNPSLDPSCRLCPARQETIEHILAVCPALADTRQRLHPELMNTVLQVQQSCAILNSSPPAIITQFVLDCTSTNLPEEFCVPSHNPLVQNIFTISRDWCYALSNARSRLLQDL